MASTSPARTGRSRGRPRCGPGCRRTTSPTRSTGPAARRSRRSRWPCAGCAAGDTDIALAGGAREPQPGALTSWRACGSGSGSATSMLDDQLVISCPLHRRAARGAGRRRGRRARRRPRGTGRVGAAQPAAVPPTRCGAACSRRRSSPSARPTTRRGPTRSTSTSRRGRARRPRSSPRSPTVNGSATVTAGNAPGLSTGAAVLAAAGADVARGRGLARRWRPCWAPPGGRPPAEIASIPAVAAQRVLERCGLDAGRRRSRRDQRGVRGGAAGDDAALGRRGRRAGRRAARADERQRRGGGARTPDGGHRRAAGDDDVAELRRRGGGLGLVTMCGGIGEGDALLIRVDANDDVGRAPLRGGRRSGDAGAVRERPAAVLPGSAVVRGGAGPDGPLRDPDRGAHRSTTSSTA